MLRRNFLAPVQTCTYVKGTSYGVSYQEWNRQKLVLCNIFCWNRNVFEFRKPADFTKTKLTSRWNSFNSFSFVSRNFLIVWNVLKRTSFILFRCMRRNVVIICNLLCLYSPIANFSIRWKFSIVCNFLWQCSLILSSYIWSCRSYDKYLVIVDIHDLTTGTYHCRCSLEDPYKYVSQNLRCRPCSKTLTFRSHWWRIWWLSLAAKRATSSSREPSTSSYRAVSATLAMLFNIRQLREAATVGSLLQPPNFLFWVLAIFTGSLFVGALMFYALTL